jgi:hypothetical protein
VTRLVKALCRAVDEQGWTKEEFITAVRRSGWDDKDAPMADVLRGEMEPCYGIDRIAQKVLGLTDEQRQNIEDAALQDTKAYVQDYLAQSRTAVTLGSLTALPVAELLLSISSGIS